jgi:hypothetical protein
MVSRAEEEEQSTRWPETVFILSSWHYWVFAVLFMAFTATTAARVFDYGHHMPPFLRLLNWLLLIFSPIASVLYLRNALKGSAITVGPRGVRATLLSPDWIPWTAITGVSVVTNFLGRRSVWLQVERAFEARMSLDLAEQFNKWLGSRIVRDALGYHGLSICWAGQSVDVEALKRTIEDGMARARGG